MTSLADAFQALLAALDRLDIPFLISGSVASGTHGLPRQTNDIDILADLRPDVVAAFCQILIPAFYVDLDTAVRSLEAGRSFNVIHVKSAYKFDIFPVGQSRFGRSELSRRRMARTTITGLESIEFPVASPEDSILSKLVWYRQTGGTSDRQWRDILGVIEVQAGRLDRAYLEQWAAELGVTDLLANAFG